jgi:hypothetical protein
MSVRRPGSAALFAAIVVVSSQASAQQDAGSLLVAQVAQQQTAIARPLSGPIAQPVVQELAEIRGDVVAVQLASPMVGSPTAMTATSAAGFWIFVDAAGVWHLRASTGGAAHTFRGRIQSEQGALQQVTATRLEFGDRVRQGPNGHVNFAFAAAGGVDGIDFRAPDGACVRFHLQIDNAPAPAAQVRLGLAGQPAPGPSFRLCKEATSATRLPAQPAFGELPEIPAGAHEVTLGGPALGRPTGLQPGAPATYWIWTDATGEWHLRTTTAGLLHEFRGRVTGAQGPIVAVTPSRTEFGDHIRLTPRGDVSFAFATQGGIDGFDFRPGANRCVRFRLQRDGGPTPRRVLVGAAMQPIEGEVFALCAAPAGGAPVVVDPQDGGGRGPRGRRPPPRGRGRGR